MLSRIGHGLMAGGFLEFTRQPWEGMKGGVVRGDPPELLCIVEMPSLDVHVMHEEGWRRPPCNSPPAGLCGSTGSSFTFPVTRAHTLHLKVWSFSPPGCWGASRCDETIPLLLRWLLLVLLVLTEGKGGPSWKQSQLEFRGRPGRCTASMS